MTKELNDYIKRQARFDPTDIFGKARIRKLIFEYEDLRNRKNKETSDYQQIMVSQAVSVETLIRVNKKLEAENKYLSEYIKNSDRMKENLARRNKILESENKQLKEKLESTIKEQ